MAPKQSCTPATQLIDQKASDKMLQFTDAHNHLQDGRLSTYRDAILAQVPQLGIRRAVVNGTREHDWDAVARMSEENPWIVPSFGLHPWYISERSEHWLATLTGLMDKMPQAVIGEVGLDRWIEGYDLEQQKEVFAAQLHLAAARNRPITIHCMKAWGALWEMIRTETLPTRGFLLHAYSGPAEMVRGFVECGAYFSFSTYFLHERKSAQREIFRTLPLERLLVETDAPDMAPPPDRNGNPIIDPESEKPLNHPANLLSAYEELARVRQMELPELTGQVDRNFKALFEA